MRCAELGSCFCFFFGVVSGTETRSSKSRLEKLGFYSVFSWPYAPPLLSKNCASRLIFDWCLFKKSLLVEEMADSEDWLTWPSRVGGECSLPRKRFDRIFATLPEDRRMSTWSSVSFEDGAGASGVLVIIIPLFLILNLNYLIYT